MIKVPVLRRRPRTALALSGVGVQTGTYAIVRVSPAPWGAGLSLARDGVRVQLTPAVLRPGAGCTRIEVGGQGVSTLEHLLAALLLAGITDASLSVRGPEIPILDGSALPFWSALQRAGVEEGPPLSATHRPTVEVFAAGGRARLTPSSLDRVTVYVDFPDGPRGSATHTLGDPPPRTLLSAKTFARASDLPRLRRQGRGRGACPLNTNLYRRDSPSGPAVRHLLLDAIGDRAFGAGIGGHAELWRPSHTLSAALWSAALKRLG